MIPNDKLITIINKMIDSRVQGADKYMHMGSTWLIFTEQKQWVVELTKEKTLWYNYNFFKKIFEYFKLDVVESQSVITKWVEDTIINGVRSTRLLERLWPQQVEDTIINGVKYTEDSKSLNSQERVEDTIINGVKHTRRNGDSMNTDAEDTIENGVKYTSWHEPLLLGTKVEDTIQNGVKHTSGGRNYGPYRVEDTIENGVKDTKNRLNRDIRVVEDTIENGVKKTKRSYESSRKLRTKDTVQNGVKKTHINYNDEPLRVEDTIENGVKETEWINNSLLPAVEDAIENGIKETKSPGADGDLLSTLEWMESNNTVNIPKLIDDVIENGVKHTEAGWAQYNSVDDVIERGIKRTEGGRLFDETKVDRIISEGVKETKCGGYLSSIEMKGKMVHQLESPKQNNEVDDVIEQGVKLTNSSLQIDGSCVVEDVIQNGIKETHDDVYHHKGRVDGVIRNGVKEIYPAYKMIYNPMNFEPVISEEKRITDVTDVIRDGIKEVQPLPAQDGNRDWGVYYNRQEDRTKPFTEYVDDVLIEGKKI